MRFGRVIAGSVLLLFLPLLAACSTSSGSTNSAAPSPGSGAASPSVGAPIGAQPSGGGDLNGTSWTLTGGPFPDTDLTAAGITLDFAGGKASGSSGVNRYNGSFTSTTDGSLQFGTLASTLMAGPDAAMKLEQAYLTALQQTFGYTLDGGTLTLFGVADQVMVFTAA